MCYPSDLKAVRSRNEEQQSQQHASCGRARPAGWMESESCKKQNTAFVSNKQRRLIQAGYKRGV
jgi:hypothetical protein